jgi:hypothetical protein
MSQQQLRWFERLIAATVWLAFAAGSVIVLGFLGMIAVVLFDAVTQ